MVILVVLDSWAWRERKPGVPRFVFRRDKLFDASLYTDEGNRRRRLVVRWFALTMALAVVTWVAFLVTAP